MSYSLDCAQCRSNLLANVLYITFPAHILIDMHTKRFRSSKGPRIVPWVTPHLTNFGVDINECVRQV